MERPTVPKAERKRRFPYINMMVQQAWPVNEEQVNNTCREGKNCFLKSRKLDFVDSSYKCGPSFFF